MNTIGLKNLLYVTLTTFLIIANLTLSPSNLYAQNAPYKYQSDVAGFSITFPGKPRVLKTEGNTDIQFEDDEDEITYIVGYKKSDSDREGLEFCQKLEESMRNNDIINIISMKHIDFKGIPTLRSLTTEEHKYQLFSYVRYDFELKGYEITLMLMSKEEGLMLKDIKKFVSGFEVSK